MLSAPEQLWPQAMLGAPTQTHLLVEGPAQERVVGSFHHHEEQGQMGPTPGAVPIQVNAQTHLVAILACVESC